MNRYSFTHGYKVKPIPFPLQGCIVQLSESGRRQVSNKDLRYGIVMKIHENIASVLWSEYAGAHDWLIEHLEPVYE